MHDGSIASLCDAVLPHGADGEAPQIALTVAERRDLVAFLRTLSARDEALLIDEATTRCH